MLNIIHKCPSNQVVCLEVACGFTAKIGWFSAALDFDHNVSPALASKCTSDCSLLLRQAVQAHAHSQVCFENRAEQTGFWAQLSLGLRKNLLPIWVCVIVSISDGPLRENDWFSPGRHQNLLHHPRLPHRCFCNPHSLADTLRAHWILSFQELFHVCVCCLLMCMHVTRVGCACVFPLLWRA